MSGGQGRLKPSPGIFFIASMPSLLPLAISLLAWSSTSDGPLVKMLSRCGSVLAKRWKRTSLVLWTLLSDVDGMQTFVLSRNVSGIAQWHRLRQWELRCAIVILVEAA